MRVNGIPVHPVRFGSQPGYSRHRGAGDNFTETPESALDREDVTNKSEKARTVPSAGIRKNGLMLDA